MSTILQVHHLNKQFGTTAVVKDLSFEVKKGEFFSFLGVNGAGKSTTINMLCTLLPHTSGEVLVCNHVLGKENKAIRTQIGAVFQNNTLDDYLTIKENLLYRGYLYQQDSRKIKKQLQDVCDILDIGDLLDKKFKTLSGGQKRRCEIARALIHKPEILFLDEPTTGLDPKTKQLVWQCIETLRKELDMSIFLTTHYMEEAANASHIGVIHQGKLIADTTPTELKSRYACDTLYLQVNNPTEILPFITATGLDYQLTAHTFTITLPHTRSALPILHQLKDTLLAFEVIQGTMEDAFLNLIEHTTKGVTTDANRLDSHKTNYEAVSQAI